MTCNGGSRGVPLHVYFAGEDVLEVASEAYTMFMSENALAPSAFPSLRADGA